MSSHSRSPSPPRRSPGSRSNSPRAARSRSRSGRSRSRTRSRSRRSSSGHYRRRTRSGSPRSRSPRSRSRSHPRPTKVHGDRENPTPSNCLGVFGLNFTTTERDLEREFGRYGNIESVQVVLDGPTKRSRGFAFIYFKSTDDAEKARDNLNGTEIAGFKIRVDFSITKAAHKPTPGVYFHHGKATRPGFRLRDGRGGGRRGDPRDRHERDRYYDERDKYYDRRPPPYYERGYDKYDRDYYGGPPRRDERYYDYHRDPRDRERDRYYEDKDRHERDRYYEERDKYYDRRPPPGHYDRGYEKYERDRGYDRYERDRYAYPSSSSRRSPSPGAPPPHRRDY